MIFMKKTIAMLIEAVIILLIVGSSYQQDNPSPSAQEAVEAPQRNLDDYPNELPGALTVFNLDHGMSLIVNFTQYSNYLLYSIWFKNPNNFAYWNKAHTNSSTCLAYVLGTPRLVGQDSTFCDFLPRFYENGTWKDYSASGIDCIQEVPINPCKDKIVPSILECRQKIPLIMGYIDLEDTHYTGLNLVSQVSSTEQSIYPDAKYSFSMRSHMIAYTTTNQSSHQMYRSLECKNNQLGNGTIDDFHYYERNAFGYDIPSSSSGVIKESIISTCFIVVFSILFSLFHYQ